MEKKEKEVKGAGALEDVKQVVDAGAVADATSAVAGIHEVEPGTAAGQWPAGQEGAMEAEPWSPEAEPQGTVAGADGQKKGAGAVKTVKGKGMELKFKKLNKRAVLPKRAHKTDAGLDLVCVWAKVNAAEEVYEYGCGLAVEIPEGYVGLLFPRSSVYRTGMVMSNCVGVIDSGYRGEIMAKFYARGKFWDVDRIYKPGDRFCQLVVMPCPMFKPVEVKELEESDRGEGGYGSSGK